MPDTSLSSTKVSDWKQFARKKSEKTLGENKSQSVNKQVFVSERVIKLELSGLSAERWTLSEIRRQLNSVLSVFHKAFFKTKSCLKI